MELEKTLKVETGQGVSPRAVWHSLENRDGVYKNAHVETGHDTPHKTIHERERRETEGNHFPPRGCTPCLITRASWFFRQHHTLAEHQGSGERERVVHSSLTVDDE